METKFKNKKIVRQVIDATWNPFRIASAYERYENGMSVEDIIATDYADIEKAVLHTFSRRYHIYLTLYNDKIRRQKHDI